MSAAFRLLLCRNRHGGGQILFPSPTIPPKLTILSGVCTARRFHVCGRRYSELGDEKEDEKGVSSGRRLVDEGRGQLPASPSITQQAKPEITRGLELLRQKKTDFERIMGIKKPSPSAASGSMAKPTWDCPNFNITNLAKEDPIRTRFAPSPTGYLHLGSLRTALFNKLTVLMANNSEATASAFVLRIEDTDQSRVVQDAEKSIMEDLSLAGISWDEGPDCGGPYGPYRQSERLPIYKKHVQTLIDSGHAFRCFCSAEQLDTQKKALHKAGQPTLYVGTCRTIDPAESARRAAEGEPHCVRFRDDTTSPKPTTPDNTFNNRKQQNVDDFIILKSDGFPTYHLASVVDDHLMEITHVIRGEEWLISTPKHYALYRAFGWKPPIFEHLSLLVKNDGEKLSKRQSDEYTLASLQNVDLKGQDPNRGILPMSLLYWLAVVGTTSLTSTPRQMPRSIEELAKMLPPINYKRGPIMLNFDKLFDLNGHYRSQLLKTPPHMLSPLEHELLLKYLFAPTYNFIINNPKIPDRWSTPAPPVMELVPVLRESEFISTEGWKSTRERTAMSTVPRSPVRVPTAKGMAYLWAVLASRHSFRWSQMVVYSHPYLFWRPPISFREAAMTMTPPDPRVLDALEEVLARDDLWDKPGPLGPDGFAISDAIKGIAIAKGVNPINMHDTLRLIVAGREDCHTHATHFMFELLGRDEWKHRLQTVRDLQKKFPADFKPVTRRMEGTRDVETNLENDRISQESERE